MAVPLTEWACDAHHATLVPKGRDLPACPHMNHGRPCRAAVRPLAPRRPRSATPTTGDQ